MLTRETLKGENSKMRDWLEHLIIRVLTSGGDIPSRLISKVKEDNFVTAHYRRAFRRLSTFYGIKGRLLSWQELLMDSAVPEPVVTRLRILEKRRKNIIKEDSSLLIPNTYDKAIALLDELILASQTQKLILLQNSLSDKLGKDSQLNKSDVTGIVSFTTNSIDNINNLKYTSESIISLPNLSLPSYWDQFQSKLRDFHIPSGFANFDSISIGIPKDSYWLISATTGGGKSLVALQIALNAYKLGYRVCFVSLEMSFEQNLLRIIGNLTGITMGELTREPNLYYSICKKKIASFFKQNKNNKGATLDFYSPELSENIRELLAFLTPNNYDIIFIDYATLLEPMHKDTWRNLDMIGRFAKVYASKHRTVISLLAQWDGDRDVIRYGRALMEHACVTGDTLIDTPLGLKSIDEIVVKPGSNPLNQKVLTNGRFATSAQQGHENGIKPIIKLTFDDGRIFKGTEEHKLLVLTPDFNFVWKTVSDIGLGDIIAKSTNRSFPIKCVKLDFKGNSHNYNTIICKLPAKLNANLAFIIGFLLRNKDFNKKGRVEIPTESLAVAKTLLKECDKTFGKGIFSIGQIEPTIGIITYFVSSNYKIVQDFFDYLKLKDYIPSMILESPRSSVISCIKGLYYGGKGTKLTQYDYLAKEITFEKLSEEMAKRLQLLLDKLCIKSIIYHNDVRKNTLSIQTEHQTNFETLILRSQTFKNRYKGAIPYLKEICDKHIQKTDALRNKIDELCSINSVKMSLVRRFCKVIKQEGFKETLSRVCYEKIEFLRVKSKNDMEPAFTFELTIPKTSNYVANGLYSHNSNAWKWVTTKEEMQESGILEIDQPKARNQIPNRFKLRAVPSIARVEDFSGDTAFSNGVNPIIEGFDNL